MVAIVGQLYKGVDSEEEDGSASLDTNQYDSDDGFIDDSELDQYFSNTAAKLKHAGFFINSGRLETVDESLPPPLPSPALPPVPRTRKRKITKVPSEIIAGKFAKKKVLFNVGQRLGKAAGKTPPQTLGGGSPRQSPAIKTSEQSVIVHNKRKGNVQNAKRLSAGFSSGNEGVVLALQQQDSHRKAPDPPPPAVEANPPSPVKISEQGVTPKPHERIQPILDGGEPAAQNPTGQLSAYITRGKRLSHTNDKQLIEASRKNPSGAKAPTVEATPSHPVQPSKQSLISRPSRPPRNVQPILDGPDSSAQPTARISSDCTAGDESVHISLQRKDASRRAPDLTTPAVGASPSDPIIL